MSDTRAFLGRRVNVDSELVIAYADKTGQDPLHVAKVFGARLATERDTCKLSWVTRLLGWKCSACGRITRGNEDAPFNFCPNCGAASVGGRT